MKALCAALISCAAAIAFAADETIPIESFFKTPRYRNMTISPDGRSLAAIAPIGTRQNIVVIDIATRQPRAVTSFATTDVFWCEWINSKRLVFGTGKLEKKVSEPSGGTLMAVDSDGSNFRDLWEARDASAGSGRTRSLVRLIRRLPGETDDVIAEVIFPGRDLVRLDTRTGHRTSIGLGKPDSAPSERWIVDARGVARVFVATGKGVTRVFYRAGPDAAWQLLEEGKSTSLAWSPRALGDDDRTLIVSTSRRRDKSAIASYDPEKRELGEILAQHPQVDLGGLIQTREGRVLGVNFDADRGGTAWFDTELARIQKAVDGALPDTVNRLHESDDFSRFVVFAYSDVKPGSFFFFEPKTGKLEWLADSMPWIDSKRMSHMAAVSYKARDGLEIPAFLTVPRGREAKNLPLVVVVHGGPYVRGERWGYSAEAQFLASRGYAVLEPNFRGTTGYGWKHFASSFKQWGLAMQDDVADGVRWAVDTGVADPKRVCIYGASYGGYAAMMGVIKDPDLYKCAINYVGVTDLELLLTATWSDNAYSDWMDYNAKERIGDLDNPADRERLMATSPVNAAARIKVPVLLAYGAADVRVVPEHGTRMRAALEKLDKKHEWMMVEGEGHGFRDPENEKMFYSTLERFLDRYIGEKRD